MKFGLESAREYIDHVQLRFATTMPQWPHEYTVKRWRPQASQEFEDFSLLIQNQGVPEPWPAPPQAPIYNNHYLVIDGSKYWAMGPLGDLDPPEEKTVINRAAVRLVIDL